MELTMTSLAVFAAIAIAGIMIFRSSTKATKTEIAQQKKETAQKNKSVSKSTPTRADVRSSLNSQHQQRAIENNDMDLMTQVIIADAILGDDEPSYSNNSHEEPSYHRESYQEPTPTRSESYSEPTKSYAHEDTSSYHSSSSSSYSGGDSGGSSYSSGGGGGGSYD